MLKLLILIVLLSFDAYAIKPIELRPLCYSRESSCGMASSILTLPPTGNFRVRSRCRLKTPLERKKGLCHQWNSVLQIQSVINLPTIGQWVWRNQCFNNLIACKHAAEIWRELSHERLSFYAECKPFRRKMWNMTDIQMRKNGIFKCGGSNYIELKIRAKRVR